MRYTFKTGEGSYHRMDFTNICDFITKNKKDCRESINIDFNQILKFMKESNTSLDKAISECISHEVIHSVLYNHVSYHACKQFDNLCQIKVMAIGRKVEDTIHLWHGGLPESWQHMCKVLSIEYLHDIIKFRWQYLCKQFDLKNR